MRLAATRTVALVVVTLLTGSLAGCGAGDEIGIREQTQIWYGAGDGANADAGDIAVRNALVVVGGEEQAATVLATFANAGREDDQLVQVQVAGASAGMQGTLRIPARGTAALGAADGPRAQVDQPVASAGRYVEVTFVFAQAPRASVRVLAQEAVGVYAELGPTPAPTGPAQASNL